MNDSRPTAASGKDTVSPRDIKDTHATEQPHDLPSRKDLEKEISQYLAAKYGDRIRVVSEMVSPREPVPAKDGTSAGSRDSKKPRIRFDMKPEELESYLNEYVVKQDKAKAILATKICTHFNRIAYLQKKGKASLPLGNIKNNIVLIGPTGVGKTYLVKLIAAKLGVPFVKGDATKFSETGYVGGDVEDLIRDLVEEADGDLERARYGIVYLDEIDKIASSHTVHGPDVSRAGVQRALLKPLEETEVNLRTPHDPISQLEALEQYRRSGKREKKTLNTRHILFIMSGAFAGLADIIKERMCKLGIGFGAELDSGDEQEWLNFVKPRDLIEYGFESEFVGRLPVIAVLEKLTEDDLLRILRNPNSSIVVGKKQDFRAYGIDLRFEPDALRLLAHQAYQEGTGARSLVSVVERALMPFEKKLPSTDITYLVVTRAMVEEPEGELDKILESPNDRARKRRHEALVAADREALSRRLSSEGLILWEKAGVKLTPIRLDIVAEYSLTNDLDLEEAGDQVLSWIMLIKRCERNFFERSGIHIEMEDEAIDAVLESCRGNEKNINASCERLCNILDYGFSLIKSKTGRDFFTITAEAVKSPELYVNRLIRSSYKPPSQGAAR